MSTDGQPGKDTDGGDTVVWCWVEQPSGWQLICQLAKQLVRQSEKTVVTSAFCFLLFCQETIGKQTVKALPGFRLNNGALAVTQRTQWKWLPILAAGFCSIFWFPPPQLSPPRHTRSKPFAKVTLDWTLRLQSQHSIFSCTSFSLSVWRPPASWGLKVRSHYSSGDGGGGKRQHCASKQNSQLSAVITMLECADRLASSALWHRGMMAGRLF